MISEVFPTRFICSPENPWTEDVGRPVVHPNAHEIGEQEDGYPGGDIVTYKCPDCGHQWRSELPQ